MSTHLDIGDDLPNLRLTLSPQQIAEYALSANQGGPRFLSDEGAKKDGRDEGVMLHFVFGSQTGFFWAFR